MSKPEKIHTVGYFNPNNWSILINISALGINSVVESKKFFLDRSGQKINDPVLDSYVGPGMLSRETSKEPVALRHFPRLAASPSPEGYIGFNGDHTVVKDSRGIVQDTTKPLPPSNQIPSVRAYTVEEAVKAGLLTSERPASATGDAKREAKKAEQVSISDATKVATTEVKTPALPVKPEDKSPSPSRTAIPAPVETPVMITDDQMEEEALVDAEDIPVMSVDKLKEQILSKIPSETPAR